MASRPQVRRQTAVTVTCSCFGFFSFNLPVLYPPYFSNRSKNLKKRDEYSGTVRVIYTQSVLQSTDFNLLCRLNPKTQKRLTWGCEPPSSSSVWASDLRGGWRRWHSEAPSWEQCHGKFTPVQRCTCTPSQHQLTWIAQFSSKSFCSDNCAGVSNNHAQKKYRSYFNLLKRKKKAPSIHHWLF